MPSTSTHIRVAISSDAEALAGLIREYLAERYPDHPGTGSDQLREEVLGDPHGTRFVLAQRGANLIGFMSWDRVYDVHWAARGANVGDLYVQPRHRGHGVALALTAAVCAFSQKEGGVFLRGGSFDRNSPTGRFYERFAVAYDSAECHCGARAFRHLAGLHGNSVRAIASSVPPKEWNFET